MGSNNIQSVKLIYKRLIAIDVNILYFFQTFDKQIHFKYN